MLDAGVRAMRMGQGRACISARVAITCSLTVSLMGWWRRVGVPCFSFNEQRGCGEGAAGHGTHEAGGTTTGEGPPASLYAAFQRERLVFKEFLFVCNNEV